MLSESLPFWLFQDQALPALLPPQQCQRQAPMHLLSFLDSCGLGRVEMVGSETEGHLLAIQAPTSNTKRTYVGSLSQVLVVNILICDLWSTDCLLRFLELAIIVGVGGVAVWATVAVAELAHGE